MVFDTKKKSDFILKFGFPKIRFTKSQQWCRWWFGVNTLRPRQNGRYFPDNIFKWIFFKWKVLHSEYNLTGVCSQWSNWQYPSIGSDNSLTPNRRHPIIWTIDGLDWWRKYASLRLNLNQWWPNTYMRHQPSVYLLFTDVVKPWWWSPWKNNIVLGR